jgi:septal ring factor EnvC (AmiA/AmiB activator)
MRSMAGVLAGGLLALGLVGAAMAQPAAGAGGPQGADWRQQLAAHHDPQRAIDDELSRLTRDLQLTPQQVAAVTPILHEHQDRIQALLDDNPSITREAYQAQVHLISQQTHDQINSLLTARQLELMKAMVGRLDQGRETRRAP